MDLDAIYHAIEYEDEAETKSKALSVFAGWAQGTYGSEPDTDIFIVCPRTTDGTVVLESNHGRLMDSLAKLGEPQGVAVFKATLEYTRKGIPINLEAFTPQWVTIKPLGERSFYLFDKDTMYKEECTLKDIHDIHGQLVCSAFTANKSTVLPPNAFTSQPPNHTFFNHRPRVSIILHPCSRRLLFIQVIRATFTEGPSRNVSRWQTS